MLDVLQIERNPLEWPPKSEIDSCGGISNVDNGKEWIRNLQNWIETNSSSQEYDDSGYSEQPRWGNDSYASILLELVTLMNFEVGTMSGGFQLIKGSLMLELHLMLGHFPLIPIHQCCPIPTHLSRLT
jgi:hypothetical protein